MKIFVWFLIFSMLSGASELLTLAAGGYLKGKLGWISTRLRARPATTLARTRLLSWSKAEKAPVAGALEHEEAEFPGGPGQF